MTRLTAVLLLVGIAVLCGLVAHIGPGTLASEIHKLGFNLLWVLVPSAVSYVLDAFGWRHTLGRHAHRITFFRLFMTRMGGEAVNFTTPAAYLGGEPVKAYMLSRHNIPLVDGLASVVTAKTTMTLAQVLFIVIGLTLSGVLLSGSADLLIMGLLGLGALGFGVGLFVAAQRHGLFMSILRILDRLHVKIRWIEQREHKFRMLDEAIADFYKRDRRGFLLSTSFFFGGWMVGAVETYLILYFLGLPVDVFTAVAIEALAVFVKGGTAFIPGSLGGQEAGNVLLFVAFGYTEAIGATYAIMRRIREIFWIAFGLIALTNENRRAAAAFNECGRPPE